MTRLFFFFIRNLFWYEFSATGKIFWLIKGLKHAVSWIIKGNKPPVKLHFIDLYSKFLRTFSSSSAIVFKVGTVCLWGNNWFVKDFPACVPTTK